MWVLTDRGSECCGDREHHEYALYLDCGEHRAHEDQGEVPADKRDMRAVQQDMQGRVLLGCVPQEGVPKRRGGAA